jgi:hypothetical protein
MDMHAVKSSNVAKIGYENGLLVVEFKNGSTYHHADVPQSVYDDLMAASSKGGHYAKAIRGKFKTTKAGD